jgi:hypothetical protein
MTAERGDIDTEPWPAAVDPIRSAFASLFAAIIEGTATGSRERTKAMSEALEAHRRIVDAMRPRSRLH